MRFYYVSIFSLFFLALLYAIVLGIFWFVRVRVLKRKFSGWAVWGFVALVLVAPWLEEFWIAYNFGQLCRKDAGIFIHKTVEVEGFYDDTHSWRADKLRRFGFSWVEGRARTTFAKSYWRHEWDGEKMRSFKIEHPTARYHYRHIDSLTPVSHQIKRVENAVIDVQTGDKLGQYVNYYRGPNWFFIHLGRPTIPCKETEAATRKYGTLSMYALTLSPLKGDR